MGVNGSIIKAAAMMLLHFMLYGTYIPHMSQASCKMYAQNTKENSTKTPCNDLNFYSDKQYFRATGMAEHQDLQTAKRIASLEARTQLASNISIRVKSVTRNYFLEQKIGDNGKHTAVFEGINRLTSSQQLKNIYVVCSETNYKNNQFIVRLAVEVATEDVLTNLMDAFSNEPATKDSYDKSMLEKVFIKEIETLEDE